MLELKVLALLFVANGAPIIAEWVLDRRWSWPVDGGRHFADGRSLLGPTKTIRGVALGMLAGMAAAPLMGLPVSVGLVAGFSAMLGDLLSSFVKRRQGRPSSSMALGIDQIPESLLPALALKPLLGLEWLSVAAIVAVFFVADLAASRLLFRLGVRKRPY